MKRLLTVILGAALLFGLVGCKTPDAVTNLDGSKKSATEVKSSAQYIQTGSPAEGETYPQVYVVKSRDELSDHDSIRSLPACNGYDEAFFEKNYLLLVLLGEGSGSVRHQVQSVEQTAEGKLAVSISRIVPEVGTCDMAKWHIILELSRDTEIEDEKSVQVYIDSELRWDGGQMADHTHTVAAAQLSSASSAEVYCGNTMTTLYMDGKEYAFQYGNSITLTDLLAKLDYDPNRVCRCMAQFKVDTELGQNYQIHLDNGFVRCDKGQAALTQAQIDTIAEIVNWAKTNC